MIIYLKRKYNEKQTESECELRNRGNETIYIFYALELPWLGNKRNVSCIPEGYYAITKEIHEKRGKVLRIHGVNGRDGVLVHKGNYAGSLNPRTKHPDTQGCILPGIQLIDISGDGILDVIDSGNTMETIWDLLPDDEHNMIYIYSKL